jgi:hypothetical protein
MRLLVAVGGLSGVVAAQAAPPVEPPAAPPNEAAPPPTAPAEPPVAPVPPSGSAPTPPADAPGGSSAPPSGSFPLPPAPVQNQPPASAPTPVVAAPEPGPAAPVNELERKPSRASEGLFEERRPLPASHPPAESPPDDTDHFKIGPVIGTGIPSVLSIGGTLKVTRFAGAGVNVGLIPKVALSYYGDATLSYQHYDIYGRLYPLGGGLFLQGGAGYATVDGTLSKTFDVTAGGISTQVAYESRGTVRTLMLTALLGYFYTTKIGFSFGVDAGAQIPIAPSKVDFSSDVQTGAIPAPLVQMYKERYMTPTDKSVRDTLEKIGRTILPTANLRLGWIL